MTDEPASNFWEQWRRDIHENASDVKPEYSNKLGIWHHDFQRDRPGEDDKGNLRYPSDVGHVSSVGGVGGFNKADLLRRGWTRTAIKRILGPPDRNNVRFGFRKDRPECVYDRERVLAVERATQNDISVQAGGIRFRRATEPKDPDVLDYREATSADCKHCYQTFRLVPKATGRKREYCSDKCKVAASRERARIFRQA